MVNDFSDWDEAQVSTDSVLNVEDNVANLRLMEEIVDRVEGLSLVSARDATSGLELVAPSNLDIIVRDITLPEMDGVQALGSLKQYPAKKATPVIAVSVAAVPHYIERGLAAGFEAYLTKPINVRQMIKTISDKMTPADLPSVQYSIAKFCRVRSCSHAAKHVHNWQNLP